MSEHNQNVPDEMKEADRLVREAVSKISEHVDSVTIFVNRKCDDGQDGTWRMIYGAGNFYARYGQVSAWLDVERENNRIYARENSESGNG